MGLRAVFFGSPDESVPALQNLLDAGHEVVAVYTRPDRRAGRSRQTRPTPVRIAAESRGLMVETPTGLRDDSVRDRLKSLRADVYVVVAYGRILPPEVLAIPRLGTVNIHPSLLPRYRGPSPVSTAILNGDVETGVTLMLLDEGMDSGPLLAQSEPVLLKGEERAGELMAHLFDVGARMLPDALAGLADGSMKLQAQDENQVSITKLIEKNDGRIIWSSSAAHIERMTRAFDPWPGAFTSFSGKNLKVISASVLNEPAKPVEHGTVAVSGRRILVATGDGTLELLEVQPEGRRSMSASDLLNGYPDLHGIVLGE